MYWDVISVKTDGYLKLQVCFADGTKGLVQFMPEHLTGVFTAVKDPDFFSKVYIDNGVLTWPDEIDLAPDAMYFAIKQQGKLILY